MFSFPRNFLQSLTLLSLSALAITDTELRLIAALATLHAQSSAQFKSGVELINVTATVSDADGRFVPGLRQEDFLVYEDDQPQTVTHFSADRVPVSLGIALDTSQSMSYRGPDAAMSKLEYAQCIAASLAYLVLQQQDSVGMVTFDQEVRALVRASSNPSHLKQLLHVMEVAAAERKTATGPIFHDLAERLKKRGIVVILSDLFDNVPSILAGLKHFRHRRHEVIIFHVLDPAELDFPFQRTTLFKGLEQLPDVLTEPRSLRRAYLEQFN